MARKSKFQIKISNEVQNKLKSVFEILTTRGSQNVDVSDIFDKAFQRLGQSFIDEYVSEKTPDEYKVMQILNDPEKKAEIMRLTKDQVFGLEKTSFNQAEL